MSTDPYSLNPRSSRRYIRGRTAKVEFVDTDPRPLPSPESGSTPEGNPERSGGAAAASSDATASSAIAFLACPLCGWDKRVARSKVVSSLRGHYGYKHPERRLPEPRECVAAIVATPKR